MKLRNQQTCTFDNRHMYQGRSDFQVGFCRWFIIDLLLEHKFCYVNLIGRSWRLWENNPSNTHTPSVNLPKKQNGM